MNVQIKIQQNWKGKKYYKLQTNSTKRKASTVNQIKTNLWRFMLELLSSESSSIDQNSPREQKTPHTIIYLRTNAKFNPSTCMSSRQNHSSPPSLSLFL